MQQLYIQFQKASTVSRFTNQKWAFIQMYFPYLNVLKTFTNTHYTIISYGLSPLSTTLYLILHFIFF